MNTDSENNGYTLVRRFWMAIGVAFGGCLSVIAALSVMAEDLARFEFENGTGDFWLSDSARVESCLDEE